MARQPRFDLPGIPQHVVQRGNNRLPCFLDDLDRQRYLQCLRQALGRFGCRLHAYVLMSNHVHLLLTPDAEGALSRLMHTFSRNYAGLFNGRHGRTDTLWEGRYKACLVDSGSYFLACSRYVELNPVRAWMVARPADYPWSSYGAHAASGKTLCLWRIPNTLRSVPTPPPALWRTGPCSRMHCPLSWWPRFATTCSNRMCWARIDSAHGSRQGQGVSPRFGHSADRRDTHIVPDAFFSAR